MNAATNSPQVLRVPWARCLAGAAGVGIFWWLTIPAVIAPASLAPYTPNLANGLTTFNAGGCSSCHAVPNQPDRLKLGGGLALPSPFGTFYVPNISPDPNDGIGRWSEADFVTAVLKGTSPDGAHYFPAFPYASYQRAKVEDVRDLFAYLKTLAPVAGKARDHDVPFPFNIRRNVGIWKWLFMDGKPFVPDAARSAHGIAAPISSMVSAIARSATARAICSAASSKRSVSQAAPIRKARAGCPTSRRRGSPTGARRTSTISSRPGRCRMATTAGGSMARVIKNTSQLSPEDRAAMAEYLKSLPPVEGPPRPKKAKAG